MKLFGTIGSMFIAAMVLGNVAQAQELVSLSYGEPSYKGSGCPEGSIVMATSPTAFTMLYDSFIAEAGDGIKAREHTKVCSVRVPVEVPTGYQIAIDSVDHRGFVDLSDKSWGFLKSWFRVKGKSWYTHGSSKLDYFRGPLIEDYTRRDLVSKHHRQWSPCGGNFHFDIYTYMHVNARRYNTALLTLDSSDAAMSTQYGIDVRRCK